MIVIKKRIWVFSLSLFFLFLFLGCHDFVIGDTQPPLYDVHFSPKKVKRGEELVITFKQEWYEKSIYINWFNRDVTADTVGNLMYIGTHPQLANNYPDEESRNMNRLILFGIQIPEEAASINKGKKKKSYGDFHADILKQVDECECFPVEYLSTSEKTVKKEGTRLTQEVTVRCIVPDNAVSGHLNVMNQVRISKESNTGFPDEPLIIVDESGDEISK